MSKWKINTENAGANSGKEIIAYNMRATDIKINPDISKIFEINPAILDAVTQSMRERGYDNAEPIVIDKITKEVIDGHTRLQAALDAEILEIPVVEMEFETSDDAKFYCYKRQANRRNLTQAEIYAVANMLELRTNRDGSGCAIDKLSEELGVARTTIAKARAVGKEGSDELQAEVKSGKKSINKAYNEIKPPKKKPEKSSPLGYSGAESNISDDDESEPTCMPFGGQPDDDSGNDNALDNMLDDISDDTDGNTDPLSDFGDYTSAGDIEGSADPLAGFDNDDDADDDVDENTENGEDQILMQFKTVVSTVRDFYESVNGIIFEDLGSVYDALSILETVLEKLESKNES